MNEDDLAALFCPSCGRSDRQYDGCGACESPRCAWRRCFTCLIIYDRGGRWMPMNPKKDGRHGKT